MSKCHIVGNLMHWLILYISEDSSLWRETHNLKRCFVTFLGKALKVALQEILRQFISVGDISIPTRLRIHHRIPEGFSSKLANWHL